MVIRGRTRGGGVQLAKYLLTQGENEDIHILDVGGRDRANDNHLRDALFSMSLTAELTKSDKGLYHAQINPAYGDDRQMSREDWLKAADMLGKELGLEEQRRVMVLHTKKGRTHGHVVWERYDHEKKKMVSDSFSRLAQDRARVAMEQVFEQQPTPHRNAKRPEMKEMLSDLWGKLKSGTDFVKAAKHFGYVVAAGVQRRPFMVVDDTGRSFDLVRQLAGVKTKEVREKLKGEKLVAEKDAIALVRQKQKLQDRQVKEAVNDNRQAKAPLSKEKKAQQFAEGKPDITNDPQKEFEQPKQNRAEEFAASRPDVTHPSIQQQKNNKLAAEFAEVRQDATQQPTSDEKKKETLAAGFGENRGDALTDKERERQRKRQEVLQEIADIKQRQTEQDQAYEPG